jgi:type II secretory pathway component PulK
MARLDNQKLTQLIEQCFDLSMSGSVAPEHRREYLAMGKRLRGTLLNLLSVQFNDAAPEYLAANTSLQETSDAVAKVQQGLEDTVKAVSRLGDLASKLDEALKVAEKFV